MKKQNKNDDYLTLANKRYKDNKEQRTRKAEQERERIAIEYAKLEQKERTEKHKHTRAIISTVLGAITFITLLIIIICVSSRKV